MHSQVHYKNSPAFLQLKIFNLPINQLFESLKRQNCSSYFLFLIINICIPLCSIYIYIYKRKIKKKKKEREGETYCRANSQGIHTRAISLFSNLYATPAGDSRFPCFESFLHAIDYARQMLRPWKFNEQCWYMVSPSANYRAVLLPPICRRFSILL